MTTPTTTTRIDAGMAATVQASYAELTRPGNDSVRAAWRFGQCLDSFTDTHTRAELAVAADLSPATIGLYLRFYRLYERPELAVAASAALETFSITLLCELADMRTPVERARPMAGRRYRYRCRHCDGTDIAREEIDPEEAEG
jgi:hypothetical protein